MKTINVEVDTGTQSQSVQWLNQSYNNLNYTGFFMEFKMLA